MATTYDSLTAEQRTFWEMEMLERAVPNFPHAFWGQNGKVQSITNLPEHKGDVIDWRLLGSLTAVTTALVDGQVPNPQNLSITNTTGTVEEYGSYIIYTGKLLHMAIDQVVDEAADALGEQAGDSIDQLTRTVITAGSTVQYASSATNRATVSSTMLLTAAECLEAVATLGTNNAKVPNGEDAYPTIIHPHTQYDLFTDPITQAMLINSKERGEDNPFTKGYIGTAYGLQFYKSSNAVRFTGTLVSFVYGTLVIGRGSFGCGGLAGFMPEAIASSPNENNTYQQIRPLRLIEHEPGSSGAADPFNRIGTLGWYTTFVAARLREPFMLRIEHATTLGG